MIRPAESRSNARCRPKEDTRPDTSETSTPSSSRTDRETKANAGQGKSRLCALVDMSIQSIPRQPNRTRQTSLYICTVTLHDRVHIADGPSRPLHWSNSHLHIGCPSYNHPEFSEVGLRRSFSLCSSSHSCSSLVTGSMRVESCRGYIATNLRAAAFSLSCARLQGRLNADSDDTCILSNNRLARLTALSGNSNLQRTSAKMIATIISV